MKDNWKYVTLSDFVDLKHGYQFRDTDFTENGIPIIKIGNVWEKGLNLENVTFISKKRYDIFKSYEIMNGDILMSLTGNIGRVVEVKGLSSVVLQNYRVGNFFSKDETVLGKQFIKWILGSKSLLEQLDRYSNQSAQANFGKQDLDKLKFYLPPLPQQRKIAEILSTCDDVIEKTEAAIAKYQALKQGMMHDLFTRGIDIKTGKLRPSCQDAPELYEESDLGMIPKEWEVEKSIKLMTLYNGRAYSITEWEDKGTPVIRLQNLTGSGSDYYYSNLQLPDNQYCECGDLLYMWSATFGPHIWTGPKAIYHYHIWKIACIESLYSKDFAYIELARFTEKVMQTSQGSTMAHITKGGMEDRLISVPPLKEQNLISERLNSLKKKIQIEQSTLAKYQQLKAGLMQDLLTGKVEVSVAEETLKN
jgi:type I restriction enzyme S subunit